MDNHLYNLIRVLAEKGESVWAYKKYKDDNAVDSHECKELFRKTRENTKNS